MPIISLEEEPETDNDPFESEMPVLPLRNTVLFPGVVIPITVGRDRSLMAIKEANSKDKILAVVAQNDPMVDEPGAKDLYKVATAARIVRKLRMPDGSNTVIIRGIRRVKVQMISEDPFFRARVQEFPMKKKKEDQEYLAIIESLKDQATEVIKLAPHIPSEATIILKNISNPEFLVHFIASNLNVELDKKQKILETTDAKSRANLVLRYLSMELQQLELKNKIQTKVRHDIEKQQRDYFLNQQLKTIQEELGGDSFDQEIKRLRERAKEKKWSKKVAETFNRELEKLQRINPASAEYGVILNYLDTLLDLPWNEFTTDSIDLKRARDVLEKDHYGLKKVKERILEYLAVLKLKGDLKSPILCFVGPPGVGKTSLGRSIARALKRKYVRMSLGGLHDEAEIRGHRKTYIGAMPGRIMQNLKKVKTANPVFILDEIDKVGADFRGDPSSALLEVLDPEQNSTFYDNYLELEFDLSKVLFIATANSLNSIQPALRDRMEIIHLEGYSTEEKIEIAARHLVAKQRQAHGLTGKDVRISRKVLRKIIQEYTRESGVRELDRKIAAIMRYVAKTVAMDEQRDASIREEDLEKILGRQKYDNEAYTRDLPPGVAIGMAYTVYGGEILYIESALSRGKGNLTLTGNLGDVMKESATTALTYLKSMTNSLGVEDEAFSHWNIHLHVPEGATPKDGPSAGVAMLTALASLFTQRKVKPFTSMTGEITLRGKVLPVGGIKEKVLAAKRAGIRHIILPGKNRKDIEEIEQDFIKDLTFSYVDKMEEVLDLALEKEPVPDARNLKVPEK